MAEKIRYPRDPATMTAEERARWEAFVLDMRDHDRMMKIGMIGGGAYVLFLLVFFVYYYGFVYTG